MAVVPAIPAHIQSWCVEQNGKQLVRITEEKAITQSDLDGRQCRLRLPISSESAIQQNCLSLLQQAAANILSKTELDSFVEETIFMESDPRQARELKGVNVNVFVFSPGKPIRQGQGILTKWNCGSIVIHGRDAMLAWSHLNKGDLVELWGFKDEEHKIYFAVNQL